MIAHAERRFALDAIDNDGTSTRKKLEGLLKRAKKPAKVAEYQKELATPPFPMVLSYLWSIFWRLRRRTAAGMGGREPITWEALDAFIRNSGQRLMPWEIEIIEELDDIYVSARADTDDA